jgi:DNA polymerase delta subunit 3
MKEEEEESSEDTEPVKMDDDIAPKPKPKKRREKKVVPVGRNGLKKKRVVKSRMTTDAKGYMGMAFLSVTVYADVYSK